MLPPAFSFQSVLNAFSAGLLVALAMLTGHPFFFVIATVNVGVMIWDNHVMETRWEKKRIR